MEAIDVMLKEAEEPGQQPSRKSQRKRKVKESNSKNITSKSESSDQKIGDFEEVRLLLLVPKIYHSSLFMSM